MQNRRNRSWQYQNVSISLNFLCDSVAYDPVNPVKTRLYVGVGSRRGETYQLQYLESNIVIGLFFGFRF